MSNVGADICSLKVSRIILVSNYFRNQIRMKNLLCSLAVLYIQLATAQKSEYKCEMQFHVLIK